MSEDWLVTSEHSIDLRDLLRGVQSCQGQASLRVDAREVCAVVVDAQDAALLWIGPSIRPRDPKQAWIRAGLASTHGTGSWWTEVIQPAGLRTERGAPTGAAPTDVATFAHALAAAAGGAAHPLSRAPGNEPSAGETSRPYVDVACDVLTASCAIFVQTRPVLALTAWVDLAMTWALRRGLMPVFLTPGSTHLSRVLHHHAERGGCLWIRQGAGGMHNGATGRAVAWDGNSFVPSPAQPWQAAGGGGWEIAIEGEALHPPGSTPRLGSYAQAVHDAVGIDRPQSWGLVEPCDRAWELAAIAAHAGSAAGGCSRFLLSSPIGDGVATITPRPVGTQESLTWVGSADGLLPHQTNLARLGERLLYAGSEVCVVGYRRPTVPEPGQIGSVGTLLPGLMCFTRRRFDGLDLSVPELDPACGAVVQTTDLGTVITFAAPGQPTDPSSAGLIAAWQGALRALAAHDAMRASPALDSLIDRGGNPRVPILR